METHPTIRQVEAEVELSRYGWSGSEEGRMGMAGPIFRPSHPVACLRQVIASRWPGWQRQRQSRDGNKDRDRDKDMCWQCQLGIQLVEVWGGEHGGEGDGLLPPLHGGCREGGGREVRIVSIVKKSEIQNVKKRGKIALDHQGSFFQA